MKIDLDDLAHNPAVQRLFRGMKCMEVKHGNDVIGKSCTLDMDDHGKLTMTFEKRGHYTSKVKASLGGKAD